MSTREKAIVDVDVNGEPAKDQLNALQLKAKELKVQLEKAFKAGDVKGYNKLKTELGKVGKEAKQLEKQMFDVDKVLRNLGGSSLKDLRRAQQQLNRELNNGAVKRNSKDWNLLTGKLKKVGAEMTKVRMEMRGTQSLTTRLANGFNKYALMLGTFSATLIGVVFNLRKAVNASNDFEESIANLSALTGLAGEELDYLTQRALEFSGSTTEAGIRITKSAQDIIDAYTQMGSKRPELLADKEALASVTEQAIILSQAAKMELVPATNSLAISMNQFNAEANEASRYINAIAAGSKAGAGDVLYIASALEKAGTAADKAKLNIEETIAVIETIAPKFSEPARAGTQLKNVFIRLQIGADEFNPAMIGMEQALENLGAANLSTAEMVKIFGTENLNAAQTLVDNRDEYVRYKNAVTDTNVAVEQAIINTSTNKAKLEAARQELAKVTIELGKRLAPALTFSTSSFSHMVRGVMKAIEFFNEYKGIIISLSVGIVAYTIAVNASMIQLRAYVFVTNLAKKATLLFNTAIKTNPLAFIVGLLATATAAFITYRNKVDDASGAQIKLNDAIREGQKLIQDTKSLEERGALLQKMTKAQLIQFKADVALQLVEISRRDENKLIAEKRYNEQLKKLKELQDSEALDWQIRLQQNNVAAAKVSYDNLLNMVKGSNADQLKEFVTSADERLKLFTKITKSEITTINSLNTKKAKLVADGKKINVLDEEAIIINQEKITQLEKLIKYYESLGKAKEKASLGPNPDPSIQAYYTDMAKYRADDLEDLTKAFEKQTTIRKTEHNKALAALGNDHEARKLLNEQFDKEEAERTLIHLEGLTTLLSEQLNQGGINGLSISEALLSDEEKELLSLKIIDLQFLISQLKAELAGEEDTEGGGALAKFLLGSDWSSMDLADKIQAIGDLAVKTFSDINRIISNSENQQLENFKKATSEKKEALNKQLDDGILSYEEYTARTAQLDAELEKKQRKIAHNQAVRNKAIALMQTIVNTAAGVAAQLAIPGAGIGLAIAAAILGAIQIAVVATEPVPALAKGRYPVTATDGNTYNASMYGKPKTTEIVKGPALVSELEDEMIIDGPTTRNLVFRYPNIVDGIKDLSRGLTPQFGNGRYPSSTNTTEIRTETFTDPLLLSILEKLDVKLDKPFRGIIDPNDEDNLRNLNTAQEEYDAFQRRVG